MVTDHSDDNRLYAFLEYDSLDPLYIVAISNKFVILVESYPIKNWDEEINTKHPFSVQNMKSGSFHKQRIYFIVFALARASFKRWRRRREEVNVGQQRITQFDLDMNNVAKKIIAYDEQMTQMELDNMRDDTNIQSTSFTEDIGNYKQFILCVFDYWNFNHGSVVFYQYVNENMAPRRVHEIYVDMLQEIRNDLSI